MPLEGFDALFRKADARRKPVVMAVAGGADRTVLEALRAACDRRWIEPIVAGRVGEMREVAAEAGVSLDGFRLIDADEIAQAALAEVRKGPAQLLMKGQISTPELMKAVLDPETGLRTGRVICQVVLMEIVPAGRTFLMADTGVTIHPDLKKKADILRSAVDVAHALGEARPRVALMAATEKVVEMMPETFDAAELVRRAAAGAFPGCEVQGPLSFDLAYAPEAAAKKHVAAEALKAVTLYPAQILGIADRLGSLEVGKRANLVITAGHLLQPTTIVKALFIGGKPLAPESKHTRLYAKYQQRLAEVRAGTAPLGLEAKSTTLAKPASPTGTGTPTAPGAGASERR